MKESLLKWAHHLGKGTTCGYAARKDFFVIFGFLFSLSLVLGFARYLVASYCFSIINLAILQPPVLIDYLTGVFPMLFILTIIANFSLIFMRINDICGRRYFTTKGYVFAFIALFYLIQILEYIIFNGSGIFGLLFYAIMCIYPSSSGEREEMPIVEYELPKKAILVLAYIFLAIYSLSLYGIILFAKNTLKIIAQF